MFFVRLKIHELKAVIVKLITRVDGLLSVAKNGFKASKSGAENAINLQIIA